MEDLVEFLSSSLSGVNSIDADYCTRCAQAEYAHYDDLSEGFSCDLLGEIEIPRVLVKAAEKARRFYVLPADTARFFETLRNQGLEVAKLANFLWYSVDTALQSTKTKQEVRLGLSAANLYLALSAFKSAKLYKFYDINIIHKCLELFRMVEKLIRPLSSRVAAILNPKKRGTETAAANDPLGLLETVEFVKLDLIYAMRSLFVSFNSNIVDAVLENDDRCRTVVDFLRDVAYLDIDTSTEATRRGVEDVESLFKASQLSFAMLHTILDRRSELRTYMISARLIMPFLLYWVCGSSKSAITGTIPQVLHHIRERTVRFVGERIVHMNKFELNCYMRVLKTLPLKCFDRAEYRSNVSQTYVEILCQFPSMAYYLIDDVYVLGRHNKTSHRSFAYEIVSQLLQSFPFEEIPHPPVPINDLVADDSMGDIDDIDNAEEVVDATAAEEPLQAEEEGVEVQDQPESDAEMAEGEAPDETVVVDEGEQAENGEEEAAPRRRGARRPSPPRDPNVLEFVNGGMTPKQAMLMLIISGLSDKHAKQKALQAIEDLFNNNACVKDLCLLAKKFMAENLSDSTAQPETQEPQPSSQPSALQSRQSSQAPGMHIQSGAQTPAPTGDVVDFATQPMEQDGDEQPDEHDEPMDIPTEEGEQNEDMAEEREAEEEMGEEQAVEVPLLSQLPPDLGPAIANDLVRLILRSFEDDKTAVVKHALSACVAVLVQQSAVVTDDSLFDKAIKAITHKTWDVALQVRKQAAVSLKDLLNDEQFANRPVVEKAWLDGLLHQVVDNEATVAQQATKFVIEYIFKGLTELDSAAAWDLMKRVEESSEYTRYLAICMTEHTNVASSATAAKQMGNVSEMIRRLMKSLERMTERPNCPAAAWMLLCELSYGPYKVKPECAERAWASLDLNNADDRIPTYVAKVLANCCDKLGVEKRFELKETIKKQLIYNRVAVSHIAAVCYALARLTNGILPNRGKANKAGLEEMEKFAKKIDGNVRALINEVVMQPLQSRIASRNTCTPAIASQQFSQQPLQHNRDPEKVIRTIFTLGEVAQYAPKISSLCFNMMRAGVTSDTIEDDCHATQLRNSQQMRMSQAGSQNPQMEEEEMPPLAPGAIILPDSQMASGSQASASVAHLGPKGEYIISRGVRSAIFLSLGKLSIVDESIATEITPRLARQMREDRDHCVRNNLLVVMADIFRINTTAVSDHGPAMASCLRDPSVLIRKQAVFLITSLIRDEYFKWDGQVMYFYLGALLDHDKTVREQVRASLLNVLLPKTPKMLINRFVEVMFYFNDVTHPNMTVSMQHEKENCPLAQDDRFALYGERRFDQRMEIYNFMISTFSDVENLPLMCRIAFEVFENITEERLLLVNEEGVIDRNVVGLLKDALHIVRSKEIVLTLQTGKKPSTVEDPDEENDEANQMQAVAGDVIAHTFLKTINQEVLNRMWRLKDMLKKMPAFLELAKMTHSFLLDIYENYFEHFDKLVGNDSQRRGEVKSDLERLRKRVFPRPQQPQQAAA